MNNSVNIISSKEDFFGKLEPILAPSELLMVKGAYIFAKFSHRYQKRKERDENGQKVRYFEHVRRSAIILINELHISDPELIASTLLHDSIEDTRDVTAELIEFMFNSKISRTVRSLTNIPKQGYYDRLNCAHKDVLIVKLCDRLDNVRSLDHAYIEPDFKLRKAKETVDIYIPIFENRLGSDIEFRPLLNELNRLCIEYLSSIDKRRIEDEV